MVTTLMLVLADRVVIEHDTVRMTTLDQKIERDPETRYGPGIKGKIHSGKIEDDSLWRKGEKMT